MEARPLQIACRCAGNTKRDSGRKASGLAHQSLMLSRTEVTACSHWSRAGPAGGQASRGVPRDGWGRLSCGGAIEISA